MLKSFKKALRIHANGWLRPRGLELIHRRLESSAVEQLLLAMRHFEIDLVVDVGANAGQYAAELFEHGYSGKIVSIEPLPKAHAELSRAANAHPRWEVLDRMAIGDRACDVTLQVAGNSLSSSVLSMLPLHEQAAPGSAQVERISVPQRTLDAVVLDHVSDARATLLKIDTQGYEYPVLLGADHSLEKVRLVQLELSLQPLYQDQMLWQDLIAEMARRGFGVWSIQPEFCDPKTGQLLQVNGLFSRIEK